ncbi:MAG: hypothetical protein VCB42_11545 [Myxococcota bacterium]
MEVAELFEALLELSQQAGLEIRVVGRRVAGEAELPATSGICRVRGAVWVVLSPHDPPEAHVDLLVRALRDHAAEFISSRYLPPALRERLEAV